MKLFVIGPSELPHIWGVEAAILKLGHDVQLYPMQEFYTACTYLQRKLYKFGIKGIEKKYNEKLWKDMRPLLDKFKPDMIIVLSGLMISTDILGKIKHYKKVLWTWDGIERCPYLKKVLPYFDTVFCFEYDDVKQIKNEYSNVRLVEYMPLGFDDRVYYPRQCDRDIDISFIGIPNQERIKVINDVARYVTRNSLKMLIGGPWDNGRHFWKHMQFARANSAIMPYLINRRFTAQEVADIYRRSKICLNLNVRGHKSVNPRTFEILATESFQIMNGGIDTHGMLNTHKSLVVCNNENLVETIAQYIFNDKERESIAKTGYHEVSTKMSLYNIVDRILGVM